MTSNEIRSEYLKFFEEKGHSVIQSSPLVPYGDPTLLFTTAGMVQFKPYFLGLTEPPNRRLASCQKCFRTTDVDTVGDSKHLTFFEMLGNFSIGDYFKKEAVAWGWEFVTKRLHIPPERLWVTIYLDDDEAFDYWRKIDVPADRIIRLGAKDNFWGPAGDSGPCGPCSEIHYDFGEKAGCGKPDCKPDCGCGRFSEIWNLVFTQYNQASDGSRTLLPKPNIDTGMGLERVVTVMQGKSSVYETDIFSPLIDEICTLSKKKYGDDETVDLAMRIVAEHSRGLTFLTADGVLPSNEGRGYVYRRLLRRACFFGRKLGINYPFLSTIADVVIAKMSDVYSELGTNAKHIKEVLKSEEEKFISTLDAGMSIVEKTITETQCRGAKAIDGKDVFRLYDTYGFPSELTAEIAHEHGLSVDLNGFEAEMEKQRERARASNKFSFEAGQGIGAVLEATKFIGYDHSCLLTNAKIVQMLDVENGKVLSSAGKGRKVSVVLDQTPFYGEMGGQVGDTGKLVGKSGAIAIADATTVPSRTPGVNTISLTGSVASGTISVDDEVSVEVDVSRRLDIARNHTATHLLHAALRQVLGTHVHQRGSLVEPERLRFDFSHTSAIEKDQLSEVQRRVNDMIRRNLGVSWQEIPYAEARKSIENGKIIALFGEKYGDTVRVLEVGEPVVSAELCGGTHVNSTGEIGMLLITGESAIGAGLRRIEAVTGRAAEAFMSQRLEILGDIAAELKSSPSDVKERIEAVLKDLSAERKRAESLERKLSKNSVEDALSQAAIVDGVAVLSIAVPSSSLAALRETGDMLRERLKSGVIVLGTVNNERPMFIAMVTPDLLSKGLSAGDIIKDVAGMAGGGGGGKPEFAQAGGKDATKLDAALRLVRDLVSKKLKSSK